MLTIAHVLKEGSKTRHRRVKIIATLGPATKTAAKIKKLIDTGVNVFRLNFSHGSYEEHLELINHIRESAKNAGRYVAILQDLCGPKIRISKIQGDSCMLQDGASIELIHGGEHETDAFKIYVEAVDPAAVLKPGQQVLLSDGAIILEAESITATSAKCKVIKGGKLRSHVGIAFPDSNLELAAATEKDFADLRWGIKQGIDYVAISFVKDARDVIAVKDVIRQEKGPQRVIAKIERRVAVENVEEICDVADGIMVARGDLGLELPLEKLPIVQKLLIERANYKGIPVVVATQMLSSMVTALRPTRAEVTDVSLAVLNGADAVMLSEETAIGQNPIEAVQYLHRISVEAERRFQFDEYKWRLRGSDAETVSDAVTYAACGAAIKLNAAAIIACTETGTSARLAAKYRPQQPLYGISPREDTLRRMCLYWGVIPMLGASGSTHNDEIEGALREVQTREKLPNGSRAILTGGALVRKAGSTSIMEIMEMHYR